MAPHLVGETAGVCTSILWTFGSILFTQAGRRIGALSVNAFRIVFGIVLLGTTHLFAFGTIIPHVNNSQFFYMGLSGVVGLAIGDYVYFGALVVIGPRRGVLLMSLAPVFSAISAYWVMGETLGLWAIIGIAMTLFVSVWQLLKEKRSQVRCPYPEDKKHSASFSAWVVHWDRG